MSESDEGATGASLSATAQAYSYAGLERADTNLFTAAVGLGGVVGFGNPNLVNTGCGIVTNASFTGGTSNCAAVNKEVDMVTVGFW